MRSDLFSHFPGVLPFLDGPCNLLTGCQHHLSTISTLKLTKGAQRKDTANKCCALLFHGAVSKAVFVSTARYLLCCSAGQLAHERFFGKKTNNRITAKNATNMYLFLKVFLFEVLSVCVVLSGFMASVLFVIAQGVLGPESSILAKNQESWHKIQSSKLHRNDP